MLSPTSSSSDTNALSPGSSNSISETKGGETKGGETKGDATKWKQDKNGLPIAKAIQVPDEYCCPITCDLMKDPVMTSDGHTYERDAIQEWFDLGNKTSPRTNLGLKNIE
jgi:hypothetical protein